MTRSYRLGIDVGGTFTDGVLIDEASGAITVDKVPTTPAHISEGFIALVERLAERSAVDLGELSYIIHATTTATNAVIEGRGARAGLLVTEGFRDVLEIGRQVRHELYNLQTEKPRPLIPRQRCLEIRERLDYRGRTLVELDEESVAGAVEQLHADGVESIAVCFLHSYQNAAHEQRAAAIIRGLYPEIAVSVSSDIAPEIREYWRASTAVINAYIAPVIRRYLESLQTRLVDMGVRSRLHIMQSNGGIMTSETAMERPVYMVESGPAAGVAAAAYFSKLMDLNNVVSFDMGGTTAKAGLILDGEPQIRSEFEVGAGPWSGAGLTKASGYPILGSVMDLVEVGAGGGSIAWIDPGGLLRVGPQSAGADPGPACYQKGGTQPTVTDANLVLGRINPDFFLGGEMRLSVESATAAIETHAARPLGISVEQAAMGIVDIADVMMLRAMRLVSVQRGYDPREFSLVAFGGAGPLHADRLATDLGIPLVMIPPDPGVTSALGMVVSHLRRDYRATRIQLLDSPDLDAINEDYRRFEHDATADLTEDRIPLHQIKLDRYMDVRYVGQSWKLRITVPAGELTPQHLPNLRISFEEKHEQSYGYSVPDEAVEIVNLGVLASGMIPPPALRELPRGDRSPGAAQKAVREVYFGEIPGWVSCPIFDRQKLLVGNVMEGPCVIEERESTILVHPHHQAEVVRHGALLLSEVS
jgi:N-methylhydantoinase A